MKQNVHFAGRLRRLLASILTQAAAGAFCLTSAHADAALPAPALSAAEDAAPVYRIACDKEFAPLSFYEDGVLQGIDVELLAAIAQRGGFQYELQALDFDVIVPRLVSGRLDGAMSALTITPKRQAIMDFSEGYLSCGLAAVARADSGIVSMTDLKFKTAALKTGSLGSAFGESLVKDYSLTLKYYLTSEEMVRAVQRGEADFCLEDYPTAAYHLSRGLYPGLTLAIAQVSVSADYGFAVAKGKNADLLQRFNLGLKAIRADGTYEKIVRRYIEPYPFAGANLR